VGIRTTEQEPEAWLAAPNIHSVQTVVLVAFKDHRLFQVLREPSIDSAVQLRGTGNIGKVHKLIPISELWRVE
jgi:hypothetical protein